MIARAVTVVVQSERERLRMYYSSCCATIRAHPAGRLRIWEEKKAPRCNQSRHARSVVVSTMMNVTFAWRQAAFAATTKMIVMRTNHDGFIFQLRIAARKDANHVE